MDLPFQEALDNATSETHSMQQQLLELNRCLHLDEVESGAAGQSPAGTGVDRKSSIDLAPKQAEAAGEKEGGRKRQEESQAQAFRFKLSGSFPRLAIVIVILP